MGPTGWHMTVGFVFLQVLLKDTILPALNFNTTHERDPGLRGVYQDIVIMATAFQRAQEIKRKFWLDLRERFLVIINQKYKIPLKLEQLTEYG